MVFEATCMATVSKNGSVMVLFKFAPPSPHHLLGELPTDLGQLTRDALYRITIDLLDPGTISPEAS